MSITFIDARPQGSGWSAPVDSENTRALHVRFETHGGHIDRSALLKMLCMKGFNRELAEPLTDGYKPFAGAIYWVGMGKVTVAFPFCEKGVPDRPVSVHTVGVVDDESFDAFIRNLINAIPEKRPAPAVPIQSWLHRPTPGPKKPVPVSDLGFTPWQPTGRGSVI